MIHIQKGAPPPSLTTYRQTPDTSVDPPRAARYDGPGFAPVKQDVRAALHREQRGVCCYCNDRITADDAHMKVEHRVPQHGDHGDASRDLEWRNLLGACRGVIPPPGGCGASTLHCDSSKQDELLAIDPTVEGHVNTVYYEGSGRIRSRREDFDRELDAVLCLNHPQLVNRRSAALSVLQQELAARHGAKDFPVAKLEKLRDLWRDPPDALLRPFAGYVVWWLERAIARRR